MDKHVRFKKPPTNNDTIDINGAVSKSSEQERSQSKEAQELQDMFNKESGNGSAEYMKNIQDQKTVVISEVGKVDDKETKRIDFMNEDHVNSFTESQAKKSENTQVKDDLSGKTVAEVQAQMERERLAPEKAMTVDEWKELAATIVLFIDIGISSAFKWWTKDTSSDEYSLSKPKQNMLSNQLAKILIKYQAKFPVELMFLVTLVICYFPAVGKARARKKEIAEITEHNERIKTAAAQLKLQQAQEKERLKQEQERIKQNKKNNDGIYTPEIMSASNDNYDPSTNFENPMEIKQGGKRTRKNVRPTKI